MVSREKSAHSYYIIANGKINSVDVAIIMGVLMLVNFIDLDCGLEFIESRELNKIFI